MSGARLSASAAARPGAFRRFVLAGLVNTAVGYSIYAAAIAAGLAPQVALALQFGLGVLWNYAVHARLVFAVRGWGQFPAYVGAYLLVWAGNAIALRALLGRGVEPLAAQALLLPATVAAAWLLVGAVMGHFTARKSV